MADLLGPLPDNLVRVGYISTTRGYVDGLTVYQANVYAESNPGTTFIFEDGNNNVNYLKIDQVNLLTNDDVVRTEECKTEIVECGSKPPKIVISGGGGIGAAGNPIVDPTTGAIIAIDVISGGFGYSSPPTAEVVDDCNIGSGATLEVEVGASPTYVETFDEVEDYNLEEPEEFQLDDEEIELYDPDGNLVGRWDPVDYYPDPADLGELDDPIQKEILEYQNLIRTIKNPWWTTRTIKPGSIISGSRSFPQAYNVILPPDLRTNLERSSAKVWTGFMDTYAISPVPPSNVRGSDYAGKLFTMNWSVNFPYDGEYIFRGSCDNQANLYIDRAKVFELGDFSSPPRLIKKFVKKGLHSLRIDLLNQEIYQNTPTTPINIPTPGRDINGQVNHRFNNTENRDISLTNSGIVQVVTPEGRESPDGITGTSLAEKHYLVTLDGEYGNIVVIPGTSTAGGRGDAGISVARVQKESKTTFRVWFNRSGGFNTYVSSFTVKVISDPTTQVETPQQLPVATIEPSSSAASIRVQTVFNTIDYIDKADVPLYRVENSPYDREFITKNGVTPVKTQDEGSAGQYVIRWQYVDFPVDGLYDITIGGDDNVTVYIGNSATGGNAGNNSGLIPIEDGGDEVIIRKEGFREPGKPNPISPSQVFFKSGRYRIRVELDQVIDKSYLAVAIDIKTSVTTSQSISPRSWNENPMGVALTIEAPPAPVPQEIKPPQRGRCPNNPIWSTRDPGASQPWYPVEIPPDKSNTIGDQYINRYTMSPVPPLDTPNTDGSGVLWSNTWRINVPFTGNYRIDGTKRGVARIKIDGKVVTGLTGAAENFGSDLSWVQNNFAGWEDPKTSVVKVGRKSTFIRLEEGEHEIAVELIGIPKREVNYVDEVIFSSVKSINEATVPLYHTNVKGWTQFLNRENVTPCEKANSAPPAIVGISPPLTPGPSGQVNHSFNNNTNQDISLSASGVVVNVVPEGRQSLDGIYSTDVTAKHYTITLGSNYNNIRVIPGQQTGGGTFDANLKVSKVQKISDNTWKVWFSRSLGTNTFVNSFTVQAE
jgi:hypothetical protein